MSDENNLGNCPDCKHPYYKIYDMGDELFCSDFCMQIPKEERRLWHSFKPYNHETAEGSFGVYPCAECGCVMEDEFEEPRLCSDCGPKVRSRRRTALLKEVLQGPGKEPVAFSLIPTELLERIRKELDSHG